MVATVRSPTLEYATGLLGAARQELIPLSLFGSMAVAIQTSNCPFLTAGAGRRFKDIDFVSLSPHQNQLNDWFSRLGWSRREDVYAVTEGRRAIYHSEEVGFGIDVVFDQLDFCHRLDLRHHLSVPAADTISVADLLLSKLQWEGPRPADIEDVAALLACHETELTAAGSVSTKRIVGVLCANWGFFHTAEANLRSVVALASSEGQTYTIARAGARKGAEAAHTLLTRVAGQSKSFSWRIRSVFGEALRWYRVVEPVGEPF
jgi:hypothetical protein